MNTKLKSAFIASLVLNVLSLGILFGTLSPGFGRESSRRERFTAEIERLPEPARSRFRDKMAQTRSADDPLREQIRQAGFHFFRRGLAISRGLTGRVWTAF